MAKHNTKELLWGVKGEEGDRLNGRTMVGVKAWQMLLCARDCIDISLACQAGALGGDLDQMVRSE